MKKYILIIWLITILSFKNTWAESKQIEKRTSQQKQDHHENEHHDEDTTHSDDIKEKEKSTSVGPEKGILEASAAQGIKLSPEALKNFELKTQKIIGNAPWTLPISARFQSGEEVNLYRLRDGFFKRIDFIQKSRSTHQFVVSSNELQKGDEIVIGSIGYLRIAELMAFGNNSEGHSH